MKHTLNKFGLLGLCLLLSIFVLKSVNAADNPTLTIDPTAPEKVWYRSVLHTLDLGTMSDHARLYATVGRMRFTNGLVAGKDSSVGNSPHAVIGGGEGNQILNGKNYAGIGGGKSNKIRGNYAVIGGGAENDANGDNSVVVGGQKNTASAQNSVVVGGYNNTASAQNSVVVGGQNNKANKNSLALGHNATANEGAFAWNGSAGQNSAYINASNGTLIGTTTPIAGVNLVVDGAVRVAGTNDNPKYKGEIRYVDGCFYGYDGNVWHVLNRGNDNGRNSECTAFSADSIAGFCYFGNTILWNGDTATAYTQSYGTGTSCQDKYKTTITCNGVQDSLVSYYPYCYKIND